MYVCMYAIHKPSIAVLMYISTEFTSFLSIFIMSTLWKQRAVNDVTQFCACSGQGARTSAAKTVGRGRYCSCWVPGLRPPVGVGNGSQVFTASMLAVLLLINLTVVLAAGSARVTDHGSKYGITHLQAETFLALSYLFLFRRAANRLQSAS